VLTAVDDWRHTSLSRQGFQQNTECVVTVAIRIQSREPAPSDGPRVTAKQKQTVTRRSTASSRDDFRHCARAPIDNDGTACVHFVDSACAIARLSVDCAYGIDQQVHRKSLTDRV